MSSFRTITKSATGLIAILLAVFFFCGLSQRNDIRHISPVIIEWLKQNVKPFETADPNYTHNDLIFLKDMVGNARIVSLGEATHGTREFFLMKHRILRFLVEEMDFTTFALEASWPESNLVNDYVQSGRGDPAKLLAGLHFWTWNTQEVLDMILWMKGYNENPDHRQKVSFFGFDMQYPAMTMDNVITYLQNIDPPAKNYAELLYALFRSYLDNPSRYFSASPEIKSECQRKVQEAFDLLKRNQSTYIGLSSPKEFALALQSARIVIQAEDVFSGRAGGSGRDRYMAENVSWILENSGADAKIVLWAHNEHVKAGTTDLTLGKALRLQYKDDLAIFGFSFFRGSFIAIPDWSRTRFPYFNIVHQASIPPEDSYEYRFCLAGQPFFFLDFRGVDYNSEATGWLMGPLNFRAIGAIYDEAMPLLYFSKRQLPQEFDVIIYFQDTSPSTPLGF